MDYDNIEKEIISSHISKIWRGIAILISAIFFIEVAMFAFGKGSPVDSDIINIYMKERWLYDIKYALRHIVIPVVLNWSSYFVLYTIYSHTKSFFVKQLSIALETNSLALVYVFGHYGMIYLSVIFIYPALITVVLDKRLNTATIAVCFAEIIANFIYQQWVKADYYNIYIVSTNLAIMAMMSIVGRSLRRTYERIIAATTKLYYEANTDKLTGLQNRNALTARLDDTSRIKAVAFIDVDHFKGVNDTYGHEMGDNVLREVAECLRQADIYSDGTYRLGGDEFLVLANCTSRVLAKILGDVKDDFRRTCFIKYKIDVSMSVGVVSFDSSSSLAAIINKSDETMYTSKQSGRNAVTVS